LKQGEIIFIIKLSIIWNNQN